MSEIFDRLKEVRNSYKQGMNQAEFAKALGIGQSTLGMMEVGKRNITARHIKTICSVCKVNEKWLRTGEGEMYVQTEEDLLEKVAQQYKLSPEQKEMLQIIMSFPDETRQRLAVALISLCKAMAASRSEAAVSPQKAETADRRTIINRELDAEEASEKEM